MNYINLTEATSDRPIFSVIIGVSSGKKLSKLGERRYASEEMAGAAIYVSK